MGRHHRGGIIRVASWGRHHGGVIIKITIILTFTITTGGIWESSGCIWNHHWRHLGVIWMHLEPSGWHLGGTWEASGRHLGGIRVELPTRRYFFKMKVRIPPAPLIITILRILFPHAPSQSSPHTNTLIMTLHSVKNSMTLKCAHPTPVGIHPSACAK